jgi:hypothetical protein
MALSMASFKVAHSFATRRTPSGSKSRPSAVAVTALKQNARVLHDSYNEHHGPEYHKYSGLDTTPDERTKRRAYYDKRTEVVRAHFRGSIGMDDWLFRVENKLNEFGFTGDNTIAMTSFCRDEITAPLKNGIHEIFGYAMVGLATLHRAAFFLQSKHRLDLQQYGSSLTPGLQRRGSTSTTNRVRLMTAA